MSKSGKKIPARVQRVQKIRFSGAAGPHTNSKSRGAQKRAAISESKEG